MTQACEAISIVTIRYFTARCFGSARAQVAIMIVYYYLRRCEAQTPAVTGAGLERTARPWLVAAVHLGLRNAGHVTIWL